MKEAIYLQQEGMITDAEPINYGDDGVWQEADGFYCDEGCITEDLKKKKKTKQVIKS